MTCEEKACLPSLAKRSLKRKETVEQSSRMQTVGAKSTEIITCMSNNSWTRTNWLN